MKNKENYFLLIFILLVISTSLHFLLCGKAGTSHYQLKTIFEKDLSKQSKTDYIDLFGNENQNFDINPYPFGPAYAKWYHVPTILYVDNVENVYLFIPGSIEIFDNNGNSLMKFYLPEDSLALDFYSWNDDNFYMFFKKHYEDTESQVFKLNISTLKTEKLNTGDIELLNSELRPPSSKKEMAQVKLYISSITDNAGIFFGLAWGTELGKLYVNDNERYIDPRKIIVLKFDPTFQNEYTAPLAEGVIDQYPEAYNRFRYDEIDVEKLFNYKVVCMGLGNSYVDKKGNIYLDGLKSNGAKRIVNSKGMCNSIELEKPVFFLVKLENN
jgi:hypothetical protein